MLFQHNFIFINQRNMIVIMNSTIIMIMIIQMQHHMLCNASIHDNKSITWHNNYK